MTMKTKIITLLASMLVAFTARPQIYLVDTNTPHVVGGSVINGDPLPVAFTKIDLSLTWLNNFCMTNANTNAALTTALLTLKTNLATVSNMVATAQANLSNLSGTNLQNSSVNSNKLDTATLSWLQSIPVAGGTMNFDSGTITSDGSGNASFVSIFAQQLKDSGYSIGGSGYIPVANGSGNWYWAAWPTTLSYDSGVIYSDGSGNLAGTSWRGGLLDNGWSSGSSGNVPIANGDGTWTWGGASGGATMNFDSGTITSDGSGNITAGTVKAGMLDSGYSSGSYGFMPVAMGDGTWTWMAGVTITNTITNTVTVFDFTNKVLASKQVVAYSTNYAYWDRASGGSNYLGRFQGVVDWTTFGGDDGGNPPGSINVTLYGSLSGTNNWFVLTNHYFTTNWISLAIKTNGLSMRGVGIVNPGQATIYTMDHWELKDRINYFDYQKIRINTPPSDAADIANKSYVDTAVSNVKDGAFTSFIDTNNVFHFVYNRNNFTVFDMSSRISFVPMAYTGLDGTGTNMLVSVMQTNLANGFTVQSSTDLGLVNGFTTWTNWTTNSVSGVTTFTLPLSLTDPQRFFRIVSSSSSGSSFYGPVSFNGGTIYPSNTWSLATITNGMKSGDIVTVNSNGMKLVDVWLSNSVPILKPHW
jgi:hypothetical protein